MKKILALLLLAGVLSGCTTYKFQKPDDSPTAGFLAYYDGKPIAEYTVGKDKSLPDLKLAQERFKRRRISVERYYKQTGQIQSRVKDYLWDPPVMVAGFIGGIFRWPFIAVADWKYNHNPAYKARVDRLDEEKEALETARQDSLKKELDAYIAKDLVEESGGQGVIEKTLIESEAGAPVTWVAQPTSLTPEEPEAAGLVSQEAPVQELAPPAQAVPPVGPAQAVTEPVQLPPPVVKPAPEKKLPPAKLMMAPPVAVISAKPLKGYSPLQVNFSAAKSFSKSSRIVAYSWEFGDGDVSTKKNPTNTYWSTTFGSRYYTVTLTVRDQAGASASATSTIEVITR